MKWNIAVASLVVSVAMCSQSFGFDLLDRMLGGSGCGCEAQCCESGPSCCEVDPSCGCDGILGANCGCDVVDPSCGCDTGCNPCCRKPLISINLPKIKLCHRNRCGSSCCDSGCCAADPACGCDIVSDCGCAAAPTCGCESACNPCGGRKGLLDRIFAKKRCGSSCCDMGCEATCGAAACGCGSVAPAATGGDDAAAPMPPAPVVDPSAFVAPQRSVAIR